MTAAPDLDVLRERIRGMEQAGSRTGVELPTHPALAGLLRLRAGSSYAVDSLSLAALMMAGPSAQGAWTAVVGVGDLGAEAFASLGVDLARTVLVPDPGESWLEVTAALVDVAPLVVLRPPPRVSEAAAAKLAARLRKRSAALVALGDWPRCEARLAATGVRWTGPDHGAGHLAGRHVDLVVRRGAGPAKEASLWFPAEGSARRDRSVERSGLRPARPIAEAG